MYDVVIIGAGPSGSNLARLLSAQNYKICIIEKRNLNRENDGIKIKSCGGLLAPDAQRMLAELEISIPKTIIESPQMYSVNTVDFDNNVSREYDRYYLNINREGFDRHLFEMIPDTVDKHIATVKEVDPIDGKWTVIAHNSSSTIVIDAKFLVIADGANSFTRKRILPELKKPKLYTSIQSIHEIDRDIPYYTGFFDSSITDYYAWTIQKDRKLIVGAAIPSEMDVHEQFNLMESKILNYLGLSTSTRSRTEGAFINRTTHLNQIHWSGYLNTSPYALLGEAAGATSPTSAEGISYALKSSMYLYQSFMTDFNQTTMIYKKMCRRIEMNIHFKLLKSPGMYHSKLRGLVMRSGITAIKKDPRMGLQSLKFKQGL